MTWFITHKPAYDTDFIELSKELQKRATHAHAELEQDPITPRGNTIVPLRGWENLWRYRFGDYRLIYAADPAHNVVQLLAIGPRKDVHERFNYHPDTAQQPGITFGPELAAGLTPGHKSPSGTNTQSRLRTFRTSGCRRRLRRWRVPNEYHEALMRCLTDGDLLAAAVPGWVLDRVMDALWPPQIEQLARQQDQLLMQPEDLQPYERVSAVGSCCTWMPPSAATLIGRFPAQHWSKAARVPASLPSHSSARRLWLSTSY